MATGQVLILKQILSLVLLLDSIWASYAFVTTSNHVGSFLSTAKTTVTASTHGFLLAVKEKTAQSKLHMVGKEMDPEEILCLGQENVITPEGYGFSSPVIRILDMAGRNGGYYSAKTFDIVTDVMDEITNGEADVALVFEEGENGKLEGIFTETDYILVSTKCNCK